MDLDMEMDCDDILVENHPLCEFLMHKWRCVREANEQLGATIETAKCSIEKSEAEKGAEDSLIVDACCKKYHNGKWCFIVDVSSLDSTLIYKDFDVVLKWSPIIAPQYTLMIYSRDENSFVTQAKIATRLRIIIAMESISFVRHKQYHADAVLFCTACSQDNSHGSAQPADNADARCALPLATFQLAVDEMNSGAHEIKNIHLISGDEDAMLAALACSSQIRVAMMLPMGSLRDYLVIDCMFREVAYGGNKCFVLDANASHLSGCILEYVDGDVCLVTLYVRDQIHLHSVLHHLHATIKGVTILPPECKWRMQKLKRAENDDDAAVFASQACLQSQPAKSIDADVKKFGDCLLRQIDSIVDFHRNVIESKEISAECDVTEEYNSVRDSLTQCEAATDLLYEQLNV